MQRFRQLLTKESSSVRQLFDFTTPNVVAGWRTVSDQEWGGKSEAAVAWRELQSHASTDADPGGTAAGQLAGEPEVGEPMPKQGFMRFSGITSLQPAKGAARTGFCATKSPQWAYALDLEAYPVLAMCLRTEGRREYIVNVEPESFIAGDLYQGYLRTPPNKWVLVELPFRDMLLTSKGKVRESQREFDEPRVLSFGFAVNDGQQGSFQIDVQWISAVKLDAAEAKDISLLNM